MLAANGFRGTTVRDLADRVGMTAPGLLYYFRDKEGLLRAVVEHREWIKLDQFYRDLNPDDASIRALPKIATANAANPEFVRLNLVLAMENLDDGDTLHEFFVDRFEHARRLARIAVEADIERGLLRSDLDVPQVAREVISTLLGIELQWQMDPDRFDYVETASAYVEDFIERHSPDTSKGRK